MEEKTANMAENIRVTFTGFHYIKDGDYPNDFEVCLLILKDNSLSAGCWDTGCMPRKAASSQVHSDRQGAAYRCGLCKRPGRSWRIRCMISTEQHCMIGIREEKCNG